MESEYYKKIIGSIYEVSYKMSEIMGQLLPCINIIVSSEALSRLAELLQGIPDDVKETQLFRKAQDLNKKNLHYEDVVWLLDGFERHFETEDWQEILKSDNAMPEIYRYISKIILSDILKKREKIIVLLAHMESLIYDILNISKKAANGIKKEVKQVFIDNNGGMSMESLGKIYVFAITYIIFANTDSYTEEIDKRLPFRNNILHNGILKYSDEDIDINYDVLVNLISILVRVKVNSTSSIL